MAKEKLTYENASCELDDILEEMSSESVTLQQSLKLYARAAELIAFCTSSLQDAQLKIEEINAKLQAEE